MILGGLYEPTLLPNYSSKALNLHHDKLVQHNINNNLIPTWKITEGLRPGTVIYVLATLHVFNISDSNANKGFRHVSNMLTLTELLLTYLISITRSTQKKLKLLHSHSKTLPISLSYLLALNHPPPAISTTSTPFVLQSVLP